MSCDMPLTRVHAALDGELDVREALDLESHLRTCPGCAAEYGRAAALRAALRDGGLRAPLPERLEKRVRGALHAAARPRRHAVVRVALALAAALLLGVALGRFLVPGGALSLRGPDEALVESHVRALAAGPLIQMASSDQHTVKPWFAGKLDFSPKVSDLAADGFPLEGGRVDRVAGRPAAALVYRRRKHVIDLFVSLAGASSPRTERGTEVRGFHIVRWTEGDLMYAAVSDLDAQELKAFADLVRR